MRRVSGTDGVRGAIKERTPFRNPSGKLVGDFVTAADTTKFFVVRSHSGEWPLVALAVEYDGKPLADPVFFHNTDYKSQLVTVHMNIIGWLSHVVRALTRAQMDDLLEQGLTKATLNPLGSRPWTKEVTYILPSEWGPALVYNDYTALSDTSKNALSTWVRAVGTPESVTQAVDIGFVASHAASGFGVPACNCHKYVCVFKVA